MLYRTLFYATESITGNSLSAGNIEGSFVDGC